MRLPHWILRFARNDESGFGRGVSGGIRALTGLVFASAAAAAEITPRMLLLDAALSGADIIAVGERGTILRSSDHGRSWRSVPAPARATLTGVSFAPNATPGRGWAVGHDALILSTHDGGRTWSRQFQGESLQDSFLDVLALDAQRVIAVGAYALFLSSEDAGQTWTRRKIIEDDYHFNRITRGPTGTLYLAGEHGTLLRSADGGNRWTPIAAPYEGSFYGILPLDRDTLIAHGLRGHVYRSSDDGANWHPVPTPQPVLLATGVKLRSGAIVLAGHARALLVSRDRGQTFIAPAHPLATAVAELLEMPDGNLLALGEAGATVLPPP
jgi:photosystem II stability/assembly factor-like uncharacterized protein